MSAHLGQEARQTGALRFATCHHQFHEAGPAAAEKAQRQCPAGGAAGGA